MLKNGTLSLLVTSFVASVKLIHAGC